MVVRVDGAGQPLAEARLLDVEIRAREGQLLIERRPFRVRAAQRVAEHFSKLLDRFVGARRIGVNQRRDRVQGVEQEVRIDLRAERLQLRLARLQTQLLGELFLLDTFSLEPDVLEHEAEHASERPEHRQILREKAARALALRHGDADHGARDGARQLDLRLDGGLENRSRSHQHEDLRAEDLAQPGLRGFDERLFVGGRLHRRQYMLHRFDRRELAAEPQAIEHPLAPIHQPRHHHGERRQRHREQPRPRHAVRQRVQERQGRGHRDAEHDHAQQQQQRPLDDQIVELEAVLEIDRGDHEENRRALRDALEDHAEQQLLAQEDQGEEDGAQAGEPRDHHVAQLALIGRALARLAAQHQHARVKAGQREQSADRHADEQPERLRIWRPLENRADHPDAHHRSEDVHPREQVAIDRRRRRIALTLRFEIDRVHDHRRKQEDDELGQVEPALLPVAGEAAEFEQQENHEPERADREQREPGAIDPPPHAGRVALAQLAPERRHLPQAVHRGGAIGVGAEQVDEQEHQADENHGPDGLYAKALPDDGSEGPSGRNR